jgi:hypothetical protein
MRGSPASPLPEHGPISSVFKARPEAPQRERVSTSRFAKPKILMGEVTAPPGAFAGNKGEAIAAYRAAFRAFMIARRLVPTAWARDAGVAVLSCRQGATYPARHRGQTRGLRKSPRRRDVPIRKRRPRRTAFP